MIIELKLEEKKNNNDGTVSLYAALELQSDDGIFINHLSRSPFTFSDTMTDEEIKDYIINNQYSIYYQ
jgi:hypothetical protein